MKQRYFFEIKYDGSKFFGWQIQPNEISVQETIELYLTRIHSNNPIKILGCGRTDTGVHAEHFIFHADMPIVSDIQFLIKKLNKMLPDSICVTNIFQVDADKHARFDAISRTYRYFIHTTKNPFIINQSVLIKYDLDIEKMNMACLDLIGKQDFTSLSKVHTDVKTNICNVSLAHWKKTETGYYFEIKADRFLRNMVRATVGTLLEIGCGKIEVADMRKILDAKNRSEAKTSVPPQGLFLWKVEY